jgi:hypothetical protein
VITETGDGVSLWWESVGEGPPVLLVPGRGDSTDIYPARFTDRLLAGRLRLIRYDARDTGLSGHGGSTYAMRDMADDAAAVLAERLEAILRAMNDTTAEGRVWVEGELARAAQRAPARPEAAQKHQDAAFRLGWPEHEVLGTIGAPSLVMQGG